MLFLKIASNSLFLCRKKIKYTHILIPLYSGYLLFHLASDPKTTKKKEQTHIKIYYPYPCKRPQIQA